ncbi:hypothetical protein TNIN_463311 [Trichonephila inaurata madagascariensis]|uniref:Uncharacterized protein n=1 Tax=Trichonephila inaurata madagascariensis TaxID=2747483 RepID=A0A8X7CA02_9ARAC|nr:hypothetical protein TNIN_463311 [Trichonephila inaurata madagascariensis]
MDLNFDTLRDRGTPGRLLGPSTPTPNPKICSQLQQLAKGGGPIPQHLWGDKSLLSMRLKVSGIYAPDNPYVKGSPQTDPGSLQICIIKW